MHMKLGWASSGVWFVPVWMLSEELEADQARSCGSNGGIFLLSFRVDGKAKGKTSNIQGCVR